MWRRRPRCSASGPERSASPRYGACAGWPETPRCRPDGRSARHDLTVPSWVASHPDRKGCNAMRRWYTFLGEMRTMRTPRPRRLGAREAERRLTGALTGPDRRDLVRLLAAAAGPVRPRELSGESTVVAAFVHASRQPLVPRVERDRPALTRWLTQTVAIKVVAGAAALLVGAAGLAAPAPDASGPSASPSPGGSGQPGPNPSASSNPLATPDAAIAALCHTFVQSQKKPDGKAMDPAALRTLAAAAGGEAEIPAYCEEVLANSVAPPASGDDQTPTPDRTSVDPNDPGKGHGNSDPASPGQRGHPHPSPH